jgi:hypothetical protein
MAQAASFTALQAPFLDKGGKVSWTWLKLLQQWQKQLAQGFDSNGNLISNLSPGIHIIGRDGTVGSILFHIDENGVVQPDGMSAATDAAQGAVVLPTGATGNTLGSAAMKDSAAFDAAGAATAAQGNAEAYANTAAGTAQTNAQAFASDATNITIGTLDTARLGGLTTNITTAALTVGGTQGSMTFTNGLLTAETPAT